MYATPRTLLSFALLACGSAQDWGLTGAWEQLAPLGSNPGPALAYRGAAHGSGCLYLTVNNSATGYSGVQMYDIARSTWEAFPDFSARVPIVDPFLFEMAGQLFVVDETNTNLMAFIDTSAARSTVGYPWTVVSSMSGGPAGRYGMRFVPWGAVVYAFGGADFTGATAGTLHNDVWALPGGSVVTGAQPPPSWSQVAPDGVPNFPPARVGYTVIPFGTIVIMMGGVSLLPAAPAGTLPDVCFSPSTSSVCEFHSHVWAFAPGNPGPPGEITVTAAQWTRMGANGAAQPTGRFDMISGQIGDQFFVYGGTTAKGPTSELWAYNLPAQSWGLVRPSSPAPYERATDFGYGTGALIGRHLYSFAQSVDPMSGEPLPGTGQLWRWAPDAGGGGAPGGGGAGCDAATARGHTAGIVIGILLGLGNLYVLVLLAFSSGVALLPEALSSVLSGLPVVGACLGGGKPAAPGYFSSTAGAAGAGADGSYMAPPA